MQPNSVKTFSWVPQLGIAYDLGVDGLTAPMVLLTGMVAVCRCFHLMAH